MIQIAAGGDYGRPPHRAGQAVDWSAHERHTAIGGRLVRYVDVDVGEGTRGLVCVHGMGGCWQHFSWILQSLAKHGRAIALDLPGFGGSQLPADPLTLDLLADTVAALAREAKLDRVIFIGHSMGGPIALRFARRHPQLTDSLILLAGAAQTFSALLGLHGVRSIARKQPKSTAAIYSEVLTCGIPIPGFVKRAITTRTPLRVAALWPYVHRPQYLQADAVALILAGAGARGALPTAHAIGRSDPYEGLDQIHCRILSVGATHDLIVPVADLEEFERIAPTARTILLEGAGHMPMIERPQTIIEQIDQFLADPSVQ